SNESDNQRLKSTISNDILSFGLPFGSNLMVLNSIFALENSSISLSFIPVIPSIVLIILAIVDLLDGFIVYPISLLISKTLFPIYGSNLSYNISSNDLFFNSPAVVNDIIFSWSI